MPRVKIDYVVSFSSEDSENPASNLLNVDISKKKWLCAKGEPSCSVVLQLSKSTKISVVNVGAYHAALVEVLVGRSEAPNDQFEVLVPSSIFLSAIDSRKEENVEKVRSFSSENFAESARNQKWDRVRVVCSQPYNKHCKYGLSFIQIYEPERREVSVGVGSGAPLPLLALESRSSDEDEFKPGQLFANFSQSTSGESQNSDAGGQVPEASKNVCDTPTGLSKIVPKKTKKTQHDSGSSYVPDRQREALLYQVEDDQPHAKIDQVLNRHMDHKTKENSKTKESGKNEKKKNKPKLDTNACDATKNQNSQNKDKLANTDTKTKMQNDAKPLASKKDERESRKRPRSDNVKKKDNIGDGDDGGLRAGPVSDAERPHSLLRGVALVLSGYENPRRATIRTAALALGATAHARWGPHCTHLICAFPNTPKLRQVRASSNGAKVPVVKGEWVEECARQRRRLPWQWFATERAQRVDRPPAPPATPTPPDTPATPSECDTDDEIEKVMNKEKKRRVEEAPSPTGVQASPTKGVGNASTEADVEFVRGSVSVADSGDDATDATDATDADSDREEPVRMDQSKMLPDFFEGYTFVIGDRLTECQMDEQLLRRYVRAYGGLLLDSNQLDEDSDVNYVLCGHDARVAKCPGIAVRADWVWRCHEDKKLSPIDDYLIS